MIIATISTSTITETLIKAFKLNNIEVRYVYSRSLDKARSFASENDVNLFTNNLDWLLKQDDFDTVYIASPNSIHFKHAKLALENNKNVILEKPFTSNYDEAITLLNLAKNKNLKIICSAMPLFLKAYYDIKNDLNQLDKIDVAYFNFSKISSKYFDYKNGKDVNVFSLKFSGGALMDLNVYNIYTCLLIFGYPNKVKYFSQVDNNGIDLSGTVIFTYNDFIATLISSKSSNMDCGITISSSKGNIITHCYPSCISSYTLLINNKPEFKSYNYKNDVYYEEVYQINKLFESNDFNSIDKLNNITIDVMKILDALRKDANIKFENEQQ